MPAPKHQRGRPHSLLTFLCSVFKERFVLRHTTPEEAVVPLGPGLASDASDALEPDRGQAFQGGRSDYR